MRRPRLWAQAMDVVVWLRSLGLGKYEAVFRENEIDEPVLPNLTQEDLKEIGVGPVGHRRILLDAIAALRKDASVQTPPSRQHPRDDRLPRRLPRPSQKPLASADISR